MYLLYTLNIFYFKRNILFSDPSLFYTNIPKTILGNLSQFFDMHRTGVDLNKMMILYRVIYL